MATDYAALDAAVDEELRAMYAQDEQQDDESEATEALEESSTTPDEEKSNEAVEDLSSESTSPDAEQIKQEQIQEEKRVVDEERYKNAVREMTRSQQEAASLRKQIAEQNAILQELQAQIQDLQKKQAEKPVEAPTPQPADDEIDLEEANSLYPEVVNPMKKMIAKLEKQLAAVTKEVGTVKDEFGNVKTDFGSVADEFRKTKALSAEEKHYTKIAQSHSDWQAIVSSPEYAEWKPNQAPMVQAALDRGTAADVITALNLFRAEHPKPVPVGEVKQPVARVSSKEQKLAAAKAADTPDVKGAAKPDKKPAFTLAQIEKMSQKEFLAKEAEIDAAFARGEIQ